MVNTSNEILDKYIILKKYINDKEFLRKIISES